MNILASLLALNAVRLYPAVMDLASSNSCLSFAISASLQNGSVFISLSSSYCPLSLSIAIFTCSSCCPCCC